MKLSIRAAIDALRPFSRFFIERPRFAGVRQARVPTCDSSSNSMGWLKSMFSWMKLWSVQ